jgi:hypothetical protein
MTQKPRGIRKVRQTETDEHEATDKPVTYYKVLRSISSDPDLRKAIDAAEQDDSELPPVAAFQRT